MNPEQQRIAIAEWCGWYRLPEPNSEFWAPKGWVYGRDVYGELRQLETLPDYLNDLNAMHETEEKLSESEVPEYGTNLNTIMERQARSPLIEIDICDWHATAAQRAEALLRTIGKWTPPTKG